MVVIKSMQRARYRYVRQIVQPGSDMSALNSGGKTHAPLSDSLEESRTTVQVKQRAVFIAVGLLCFINMSEIMAS